MNSYDVLDGFYKVYETIGSGGFAKVKLGEHILTGQKVAIKIMDKHFLGQEMHRVTTEIQAMSKLRHQNICQMYHAIETPTKFYLILEHCPGGELFDYIISRDRLSEDVARNFFRQIVSAVAYIHHMGYAHRDLKPENLLLDEESNLKLIDFGLCIKPKHGIDSLLNTCCGSPAYAAPELLAGHQYVGKEADMWSLGVLLYSLLCGYLPFDDDNTVILYKKIQNCEYDLPRFLSSDSSSLVERLLQVDVNKRATMQELIRDPWLMAHATYVPLKWQSFYQDSLLKLDSEIVSIISRHLKEDDQLIKEIISTNSCPYLSATYRILLNRKAKNIPPSLCENTMVNVNLVSMVKKINKNMNGNNYVDSRSELQVENRDCSTSTNFPSVLPNEQNISLHNDKYLGDLSGSLAQNYSLKKKDMTGVKKKNFSHITNDPNNFIKFMNNSQVKRNETNNRLMKLNGNSSRHILDLKESKINSLDCIKQPTESKRNSLNGQLSVKSKAKYVDKWMIDQAAINETPHHLPIKEIDNSEKKLGCHFCYSKKKERGGGCLSKPNDVSTAPVTAEEEEFQYVSFPIFNDNIQLETMLSSPLHYAALPSSTNRIHGRRIERHSLTNTQVKNMNKKNLEQHNAAKTSTIITSDIDNNANFIYHQNQNMITKKIIINKIDLGNNINAEIDLDKDNGISKLVDEDNNGDDELVNPSLSLIDYKEIFSDEQSLGSKILIKNSINSNSPQDFLSIKRLKTSSVYENDSDNQESDAMIKSTHNLSSHKIVKNVVSSERDNTSNIFNNFDQIIYEEEIKSVNLLKPKLVTTMLSNNQSNLVASTKSIPITPESANKLFFSSSQDIILQANYANNINMQEDCSSKSHQWKFDKYVNAHQQNPIMNDKQMIKLIVHLGRPIKNSDHVSVAVKRSASTRSKVKHKNSHCKRRQAVVAAGSVKRIGHSRMKKKIKKYNDDNEDDCDYDSDVNNDDYSIKSVSNKKNNVFENNTIPNVQFIPTEDIDQGNERNINFAIHKSKRDESEIKRTKVFNGIKKKKVPTATLR